MSTLKNKTITSTYDQVIKRQDAYASYNRVELMNDSGVSVNTPLYLGETDIGIGVSNPAGVLDVLIGDNKTAIFRAADSGIAALIGTEADGAGYFATCDEGGIPVAKISGKDNAVSYLNNGGNFGIGTATPSTLLEIKGPTGAHGIITINTTDADNGTSNAVLQLQENNVTKWQIYNDGDGPDKLTISDGNSDINMVIQQDGKVGIGTTSPAEIGLTLSSTTGGFLTLGRDEGTITSGEGLGAINFDATENSGSSWQTGAQIKAVAHDTWADASAHGSQIIFSTTDATTAVLDQRMCIYHDGKVGIGTATPSDILTVHGNLKVNTTNTDGNESRFKITPGGASDDCIVSIYDDNQTETIRLDASGKIGVGTTTPKCSTHIAGSAASITLANHRLQIGDVGTDEHYHTIGFGYAAHGGSYSPGYIGFHTKNGGSYTEGDLIFGTRSGTGDAVPTERMRVKSDGKIGIGTDEPSGAVSIAGASGVSSNIYIDNYTADADGANIVMRKSRNATIGSHTLVNSGDSLGSILFQGSDGNSWESGGAIKVATEEAWAANDSAGAYMSFSTVDAGVGDQTLDERMRIDHNGNIGIGTAAPNNNLVVAGSGAVGVNIERYDETDGNFPNLNFMKSGNASVGSHTTVVNNENLGSIKFWGSDGTDFEEAAAIHCEVDGTPSDGTDMPGRLSFWTSPDATDAPVERMTIKSDGKIGIGTANPTSNLHLVSSTVNNPEISIEKTGSSNENGGVLNFLLKEDSGFPDDNKNIGVIGFRCYDTTGGDSGYHSSASIRGEVEGTNSNNVFPGTIVFAVNAGGTGTTDRVRIDENGHLRPVTDNSIDLGQGGSRWQDVHATNGTIQTSDQRSKESIANSTLGLAFVDKLRPVSYKWKDSTHILNVEQEDGSRKEITETQSYSRTHYGLIAQEVKTVLDDLSIDTKDFAGYIDGNVSKDKTDIYGLRYGEFIAPLIKAVQELSAKVTALENA